MNSCWLILLAPLTMILWALIGGVGFHATRWLSQQYERFFFQRNSDEANSVFANDMIIIWMVFGPIMPALFTFMMLCFSVIMCLLKILGAKLDEPARTAKPSPSQSLFDILSSRKGMMN
jgi:hypothetical protein